MARKFPNMAQANNNAMLKQAQKMQQDMMAVQQEVSDREFSATVGGGVLTAKVNGKHELLSIEIKPEAVDPEDVEMLQDMIVAAVNEANREAEATMEEAMAKFTGKLNIPGLF